MRKAAARRFEITLSVSGVTRLLIVSYFIGLGFGLVDGAQVDVLFLPFMPEMAAGHVSSALVVGLAVLVLAQSHRRAAALLLAVTVFWASYLNMMARYAQPDIASFWRDLALIGGLLLTYGTNHGSLRINGARTGAAIKARLHALIPAKRADLDDVQIAAAPRRTSNAPSSASHPKRVRSELYRQDFEVVRIL